MFRFDKYDDCSIRTEGDGYKRRYFIHSKTRGSVIDMNLGGGYMEMLPKNCRRDDVMVVHHEKVLDFLKENDIFIQKLGTLQPGFVEYPIIQFDREKLLNLENEQKKEAENIDFFVLYPQNNKVEKVSYKNIQEFAEKETEQKEFDDYQFVGDYAYEKGKEYNSKLAAIPGSPYGCLVHVEKGSDSVLVMLTQPDAYETYAGKQKMQQNVCLNGETIGVPGVFMNGDFVFGTVGFSRLNLKTGNFDSVQESDKGLIKEFMKNTLVKNGSRRSREMENREEKIEGLMVKDGVIQNVSVKGYWTLKDKLGINCREEVQKKQYNDNYVIVYAEGDKNNIKLGDRTYTGPVAVFKKGRTSDYVSMTIEEKKDFRKILREGMEKKDVTIEVEVSKSNEKKLKR